MRCLASAVCGACSRCAALQRQPALGKHLSARGL